MKAKAMHTFGAGVLLLFASAPCAWAAGAEGENKKEQVPPAAARTSEKVATEKTVDVSLSREELRTLLFLSSLSEEKLVSLKKSIVQLEGMQPEERAELNKRLRKLWDAGERERVRLLREAREKSWMARYWDALPPEQSEAERKKFMALDNEGRRVYVVELRKKIPPPPHQRPEKSPDGNMEENRPMRPRADLKKDSPDAVDPGKDMPPPHPPETFRRGPYFLDKKHRDRRLLLPRK